MDAPACACHDSTHPTSEPAMRPHRRHIPRGLAAATLSILIALQLGACSKPAGDGAATATDAPATTAAATPAPAPATAPALSACELVTAAEMSTIMGTELNATPSPPRGTRTECTYMPKEGAASYAILTIEPGEGEAAMQGLGVAGNIDPALARSLEGIGDQAVMNGEMLNVRSGADLLQITLSGVDDVPGRARRVFDTLRAKR
jgi:hypothetical protein